MNFVSTINAFNWLAAHSQMLLVRRLKFSLSSDCNPKSFTYETALIS